MRLLLLVRILCTRGDRDGGGVETKWRSLFRVADSGVWAIMPLQCSTRLLCLGARGRETDAWCSECKLWGTLHKLTESTLLFSLVEGWRKCATAVRCVSIFLYVHVRYEQSEHAKQT